MSGEGWRYAHASIAGTSHLRGGLACQDASRCAALTTTAGEPVFVAVVADGAGSATHGGDGAELACALFFEEIQTLLSTGGRVLDIDRDFATGWLAHFQYAVESRAEARDCRARDFACTVLAAVVGERSAAFLQVGDGAIVVAVPREPDEYHWVFWPQRGEYENVTVFATDPAAAEHLEHEVGPGRLDEIALFTDGLQRLALHFASQSAHNPFFRPMFAPLRPQATGYLAETSQALATFLDSPAVNDRTDDDKTLILATRRPALATVAEKMPAACVGGTAAGRIDEGRVATSDGR